MIVIGIENPLRTGGGISKLRMQKLLAESCCSALEVSVLQLAVS